MTDTANAPERMHVSEGIAVKDGIVTKVKIPTCSVSSKGEECFGPLYVLATHCDELVAAAKAEGAREAQAKIARLTEAALFLWGLLDDIDTLDDMCRDDDNGFRIRTRNSQKRRFEVGTTDGYTVTLAALQENG